jgi:hypothetical protein
MNNAFRHMNCIVVFNENCALENQMKTGADIGRKQ